MAAPNLVRVTPNSAGLGISLAFDAPVDVPVPPILDPSVGGLLVTAATSADVTHIQLDITTPVVLSTTLVSAIAYNGRIVLTFNKGIALSLPGQLPAAYTITTTTPGAVVPTINAITVVSNQVTLYTTEQTTGATYSVVVSPGSIYAVG